MHASDRHSPPSPKLAIFAVKIKPCTNVALRKYSLLKKVDPGAVVCDGQDLARPPHHECALNQDGCKAGKHNQNLEDVSPDDGFHSSLKESEEKT